MIYCFQVHLQVRGSSDWSVVGMPSKKTWSVKQARNSLPSTDINERQRQRDVYRERETERDRDRERQRSTWIRRVGHTHTEHTHGTRHTAHGTRHHRDGRQERVGLSTASTRDEGIEILKLFPRPYNEGSLAVLVSRELSGRIVFVASAFWPSTAS